MKTLLIFLVLFSFENLVFSQENDCQSLRKGKFLLLDSIAGNTQIKRNKRIQIEKGEKSGMKSKYKVTWLDECTYSLRLIKVLKNSKEINIPENVILNVEIIEVTEKSYVVVSSLNLGDKTLKRTILILN